MKKLQNVESGVNYLSLSNNMMYDTQAKEVLVIRKLTFEEEMESPQNNDYPYGQSEIIELASYNNTKQTINVVIQERINYSAFKKIIRTLK